MVPTPNYFFLGASLLVFLQLLQSSTGVQEICGTSNKKYHDKKLQIGVAVETTRDDVQPLTAWVGRVLDQIQFYMPSVRFALTTFAAYPSDASEKDNPQGARKQHGKDPEGCYKFHSKLDNAAGIKKKMTTLKGTQYYNDTISTATTGVLFMSADKKIDWDNADDAFKVMIFATTSKDTHLTSESNKTGKYIRVDPKADGTDTCTKNRPPNTDSFTKLFEKTKTKFIMGMTAVLVEKVDVHFQHVVFNRYAHRYIQSCPVNPDPKRKTGGPVAKSLKDPAFVTCSEDKKVIFSIVEGFFSKYIKMVCPGEPFPPPNKPTPPTSKPIGPKPSTPKPVKPTPSTKKPVGPKPTTPKPGPKPPTPKPVVPEPPGPPGTITDTLIIPTLLCQCEDDYDIQKTR